MAIARACRPPTRYSVGDWQAAGGLLSTLLVAPALRYSTALPAGPSDCASWFLGRLGYCWRIRSHQDVARIRERVKR